MKKTMFVAIILLLFLSACGTPKFDSAQDAEEHISKQLVDGMSLKELNKMTVGDFKFDEDLYEDYKEVSTDRHKEDLYDMQGEELFIQYVKDEVKFIVSFEYDGGTYKISEANSRL